MSSIDLISMAIRNLLKRKLRTFLTILGVIIGTAAIVVMISLGIGMNKSFEQQIGQMGDLLVIDVYPAYNQMMEGRGVVMTSSSSGGSRANNGDVVLDDNAVYNFKQIPGVLAVTPIETTDIRLISGKFEAWTTLRGIDPAVMDQFGYKLSEGRSLNQEDKLSAVFGSDVSRNFYNPNQRFWSPYMEQPEINLMEDKIMMSFVGRWDESKAAKKYKPFKINAAGIFDESNRNTNWYTFMPIAEVKKIKEQKLKYEQAAYGSVHNKQNKTNGYENVMVKCIKMKDVEGIQEKIKEMGFEASSPTEYLRSTQQTSASLQMLLGAIGAVSLLVAAIGIANTMMMAIYERTREIGIMKVIGAALKDIKKLFLFEAALIGFLGGLFGIGISLLLSYLLNSVGIKFVEVQIYWAEQTESAISIIPVWLCFIGLGFSTLIGIMSGYFPARRAMKLSALTAIRTE